MLVEVGFGRTRAQAVLLGFAVDRPAPVDPDDSSSEGNMRPEAIIAVEFAGPRSTVDVIRRLFAKGARATFFLGHGIFRNARCALPPSAYRFCAVPLPGGWTHALLVHPHATIPGIQELRGQAHCYLVEPAYPVTRDRLLTHFASVLQALTLIPVLPHWAATLWDLGVKYALIVPVRFGQGLRAWKILPHSWDDIVGDAVRRRILRIEPGGKTTAREVPNQS